MMKKQIGIVGFGQMGKRHGLEFREATQGLIEIAGVVEPRDEMYRKGCEWNQLSIPRFRTVAEMLATCRLDGALIAAPNYLHLQILREFSAQSFPLLLEKPLDTNMESVAEIVRFAATYPGPILVDHVMRHAPIIRRARQIVDAGMLGRIASFQFSHREECGMFHNFRRTMKTGGGQLIEKATHDLDVMLYLCDSLPKKVAAISRQAHVGGNKPNDLRCSECDERLSCPSTNWHESYSQGIRDIDVDDDLCVYAEEVDVADNETCLIELHNGIFGTYSHAYFCKMPGHSRLYEVIGTEGAMSIQLSAEDPSYRGILKFFPRNRGGKVETFEYDYSAKIHYNGGPYVARHFYNLMLGVETEPFTTVNQAFVAEALGFAGIEAGRREEFVPVVSVIPTDLHETFSRTYPE